MLQLRLRPPVTDEPEPPHEPLPRRVAEQVRMSADVLAALLAVEGRTTASIDDLEWADAVAERLLARITARQEVTGCPSCSRRRAAGQAV